ncbi:hypothetical protein K523DRAFT_334152, partial [Schizophyllum commune Tattone D]
LNLSTSTVLGKRAANDNGGGLRLNISSASFLDEHAQGGGSGATQLRRDARLQNMDVDPAPRGLQLNPSTSTNPGGHLAQEQEDLTGALEEALDDTSDSSRSTIQPDHEAYANALERRSALQANGRPKLVKTSQANELRADIRDTMNEMMEIRRTSDVSTAHYPSAEEVSTFSLDPDYDLGPRHCQPLRVDIGREGSGPMVKTPWNDEVCRMVYEKLCMALTKDGRPVPPYHIYEPCFRSRINSLRKAIMDDRRARRGKPKDPKRATMISRMRTLHLQRGQGFCMHLDIPGVDKIRDFYVNLPVEVVSPDQPYFPENPGQSTEDGKPYTERTGPFEVLMPYWRNPREEAYFLIGSMLQIAVHFTSESDTVTGNFPRKRLRTGRVISQNIPAPEGLPRNFYDPDWLGRLARENTAGARNFLARVAPAHDTTLPAELIRRAARFEHVHRRSDVPLGIDDERIAAAHELPQPSLPADTPHPLKLPHDASPRPRSTANHRSGTTLSLAQATELADVLCGKLITCGAPTTPFIIFALAPDVSPQDYVPTQSRPPTSPHLGPPVPSGSSHYPLPRRRSFRQVRAHAEFGLRELLLAKMRELRFKNSNVRHQGFNTRPRTIIDGYDNKVKIFAKEYINARAALLELREQGLEEIRWRALDVHGDLRGMDERTNSRATASGSGNAAAHSSGLQCLRDATGEGRWTVSWMWYRSNTSGALRRNSHGILQGLRAPAMEARANPLARGGDASYLAPTTVILHLPLAPSRTRGGDARRRTDEAARVDRRVPSDISSTSPTCLGPIQARKGVRVLRLMSVKRSVPTRLRQEWKFLVILGPAHRPCSEVEADRVTTSCGIATSQEALQPGRRGASDLPTVGNGVKGYGVVSVLEAVCMELAWTARLAFSFAYHAFGVGGLEWVLVRELDVYLPHAAREGNLSSLELHRIANQIGVAGSRGAIGEVRWSRSAWLCTRRPNRTVVKAMVDYSKNDNQYPPGLPPLRPRHFLNRRKTALLFLLSLVVLLIGSGCAYLKGSRGSVATPGQYPSDSSVIFAPSKPAPDHATSDMGADVASEFTSATHGLSVATRLGWLDYWYHGYDTRQTAHRLLPSTVLVNSSVEPSHCWQLADDSGYAGIRLQHCIKPSAVSLYYPSQQLLIADQTAAPRRISLWSLVDTASVDGVDGVVTKSISHFYRHETEYYSGHTTWDPLHPSRFLLLGSWENPLRTISGYAAFNISVAVPSIPSQLFVLEIVSNWDVKRRTCLYKVGIHSD